MPPGTPVEFMRRRRNSVLQRCGNQVQSLIEHAVLNQLAVCRWISNITPGAAQVVLQNGPVGTDPGIYYNLQAGEIVLIWDICIELLTLNDNVIFELGYTDAINGGGNFTPIMPRRVSVTGAAFAPFNGLSFSPRVPLPVRYDSGARSITYRVDCNDAGATITPGWHGIRVRDY